VGRRLSARCRPVRGWFRPRSAHYAGSIPAASIIPANSVVGMEHSSLALFLEFEKRLGEVGRVELCVSGGRANVAVARK
jgi:hypothetical protein